MSDSNEQKSNNAGAYADEIIEGHSYDGIQEYDNPMPLWWKAVFAITVIWSPIYVGLLEMGYINTYQESLHAEDVYWQDKIAEQRKSQPELTPEMIAKEMDSKDRAAKGAKVFAANCAACHGDKGQGVIGPNLTDKYWLHGGHSAEIFHTISTGVLAKGMPAWGSVLGQDDILNVAAFVHSLKNTNVPGKAPQGDPLVEDGADAAGGDKAGDQAGDAKAGDKAAGDQAAAGDKAAGDQAAAGDKAAAGEQAGDKAADDKAADAAAAGDQPGDQPSDDKATDKAPDKDSGDQAKPDAK